MDLLHAPLVATVLAAVATAQTWGPVTPAPANSPGARRSGAMAFDAVTNRVILYGGLAVSPGGTLDQTWAFGAPPATGNWVQLAPTGGAPARWGHRMVRNTQNNRLITFGGRSPTSGGFANDTWEYTGSTTGGSWSQVATGTAPNPRYLYGLAFDDNRNVAVLFGGSSVTTTFADTWEYDGATWTQRSFPVAPPPREDMVLVYDGALDRTVLFGGYDPDTNTLLGDTWLYDGDRWLEVTGGASPSARYSASAAYDTFRKRVVLFGGYDGTARQDTFQFAGDRWLTVGGGTNLPPNSSQAYAAFDSNRRRLVLFGGFGTSFTNATYELTVPTTGAGQTGLFGTFAPGCSFSATPPALSAPAPVLGTPWVITLSSLPTPSIPLVVLGLSNRTWNTVPLPFDLGVLGFGSCALWVAADFVGAPPLVAGNATLAVPVPTNTALINMTLYTQGLVLDPVGLQSTRAGYAIIGN